MTDHCAAEICPKAAQRKKSEDGSGDKTRGGRRKRKGGFTGLSRAVAQTRSENRVGRVKAGARVIKEKSHCFGCHQPAVTACEPWELSWHNLNRVWRRGGESWCWLSREAVKLKLWKQWRVAQGRWIMSVLHNWSLDCQQMCWGCRIYCVKSIRICGSGMWDKGMTCKHRYVTVT